MTSRVRRLVLLGGLVCCLGGGDGLAPLPDGSPRVLFIGNSLTYANDLPGLVQSLADSAGFDSLATVSVAYPNFGLPEHWDDGGAAALIARGGWDVVILQQGPSALEASRAVLLEYSARFASLIRERGGRPALYLVWPSVARFGDFDRVSESYRLAAAAVDGILLPAGEGWRAAWRRDSTLALYGADGFHPSPLGTYVAALVMVHRLTGRSPAGLPTSLTLPSGARFEIPALLGPVLQAAALEADSLF